jgi:hypothetical protein
MTVLAITASVAVAPLAIIANATANVPAGSGLLAKVDAVVARPHHNTKSLRTKFGGAVVPTVSLAKDPAACGEYRQAAGAGALGSSVTPVTDAIAVREYRIEC